MAKGPMPEWAVAIMVSRTLNGIPPWVIEDAASKLWIDRILIFDDVAGRSGDGKL